MTKKPLISIVIPTRDRYETLPFTLKTILQQDFDDYEIIVSDNNSSQQTKVEIDKINSSKIKYVRSNIDLNITNSWEQAVSNANGEYIMGLADNDGIIEGALLFLVNLIKINNYPKIINIAKNNYNWPCLDDDMKNILFLQKNPSFELIDSVEIINKVLNDNKEFYRLPMIYNSIVHHSLIEKMKKKNGRIFNTITPDVYSGFCLAYLNKSFLYLSMPIVIGGNSSKSIGVNHLRNPDGDIIKKDISLLNISANHPKQIPFVISGNGRIYEAFTRAKEYVDIKDISIDRKKMINDILSDIIVFNDDKLKDALHAIYKSCEDDENLLKYVVKKLEEVPLKLSTPFSYHIKFGFNNNKLILDGKKFNCRNILDVSKFMANFYNYSFSSICYPIVKDDFDNLQLNCRIAIWGNGEYGKVLQKQLIQKRKDVNIVCFIDSFKESAITNPITLIPEFIPKDLDYIILASSYVEDICKVIAKLKLSNKITILNFSK